MQLQRPIVSPLLCTGSCIIGPMPETTRRWPLTVHHVRISHLVLHNSFARCKKREKKCNKFRACFQSIALIIRGRFELFNLFAMAVWLASEIFKLSLSISLAHHQNVKVVGHLVISHVIILHAAHYDESWNFVSIKCFISRAIFMAVSAVLLTYLRASYKCIALMIMKKKALQKGNVFTWYRQDRRF